MTASCVGVAQTPPKLAFEARTWEVTSTQSWHPVSNEVTRTVARPASSSTRRMEPTYGSGNEVISLGVPHPPPGDRKAPKIFHTKSLWVAQAATARPEPFEASVMCAPPAPSVAGGVQTGVPPADGTSAVTDSTSAETSVSRSERRARMKIPRALVRDRSRS